MTLLIGAALLLIAFLTTSILLRSAKAERRNATSAATKLLELTGLAVSGDVLDTFVLRGLVNGVEVELTNRQSKTRPGVSDGEMTTCVVRVALPIVDQMVCKVVDVDQIMGPLPTTPRIRTGHDPFDAVYAIFVVATGETVGGSYRSISTSRPPPWAQSSLLDRLLELDLLWLRVQEGKAELVFPPLPVEEVGRAALLAAGVALGSSAKTLPPFAVGAPARWLPWPHNDAAFSGPWGPWAICPLIAVAGGAVLSFVPAIRGLDDEFICGRGDYMAEVAAGDSTWLECANHPDKWLFVHWLGGYSLALSIVVLPWLLVLALRRRRTSS
jgi:hypothetical protein